MSQIMLIGVSYFILLPQTTEKTTASFLFYIFLSIALVLLFVSHQFYLKAVKQYSEDEIKNYPIINSSLATGDLEGKLAMIRQTNFILSWAIGEAVSIFGVALCAIGYPLSYAATFWCLGLANHLAKNPLNLKWIF